MYRFFSLLTVFFMLTAASPAAAKLILSDNCEDTWSSGDWSVAGNTKGNTVSVSTEQKRAGSHSYKFVLSPSAGTNVELVLRAVKNSSGSSNFTLGQEYWIGYSLYIPKKYNFGDFWTSPQFHLAPDSCDSASLNPNVGFFIEPDYSTVISIGGDSSSCSSSNGPHRKIRPPAYKFGQWNDIVLNFKFNYNSSGFFKIWVNGVLTSDTGVNASNDSKGPYMKMGIYAHPDETMTVYYDEIKIGDQNSSYDEVAPGGSSGGGSTPPATLEPPVLKIVN